MFSQVCVCPHPWDIPVPGSFPGSWSQILSQGVPQSQAGDTPVPGGGWYTRTGIPTHPGEDWPCQDRTGVPPSQPGDQDSRSSTCYAAGGMPLAVTQEDLLFITKFIRLELESLRSRCSISVLELHIVRTFKYSLAASRTVYK